MANQQPDLLDRDRLNEFLDIKVRINPRNLKLNMTYNPEPVIKVSMIVKFTFRSIADNAKGEAMKPTKDPLHPDNFLQWNLFPIPTIRTLNGHSDLGNNKPILKKQKPLKKEKLEKFLELFAPDPVNPDNPYEVVHFSATQLYEFQPPLSNFSASARKFPADAHRVHYTFSMMPITVYANDKNDQFELYALGQKGKSLKKKVNFYPRVEVDPFVPNADKIVKESILEFDIQPKSLKLYAPSKTVSEKTSFMITFSLVRHVVGPFMTVLLPVYVIAFLIPFTSFFEGDGDEYNDIASYLAALLLTLIAHHQVIAEAQSAVLTFTTSNRDFVYCLLLIVAQMIIFIFFTSETERSDRITIFLVEELIISLWFFARLLVIIKAHLTLLGNLDNVDLMNITEAISLSDYRELRAERILLEQELPVTVHLKTFFSTNLKILLYHNHEATYDVFRCRVFVDGNANEVLYNIRANSNLKHFSNKKIQAGAAKVVFSYNPHKGKNLLLEMQVVDNGNVFTKNSHMQYKREKLETGLRTSQEDKDTVLRKRDVWWLWIQSMWVEVFSTCKHNFGKNCASDWKLLWLTLELLKENPPNVRQSVRTTTNQEEQEGLDTAKYDIQSLLDEGRFQPQ